MSWTRIATGSLIGASVSGIAAAAASAYIPGAGELAGKVAEQVGGSISPEVAAGVVGAAAGALVGGVIASFTGSAEDAEQPEENTMGGISEALKNAGVKVASEGAQKVLKPLSDEALNKIGIAAKIGSGIA